MEAQPRALAAVETASPLTDEAGSGAAGMEEEQEGGDAGLQPIVDDLLHATVAAGTCALVTCSLTHAYQGPVVVLEGDCCPGSMHSAPTVLHVASAVVSRSVFSSEQAS